ncbi:MAG: mechanosensitive ion channel family protein [Prevotella sp.]
MTEEIRLWTENMALSMGATASGAVYITDAVLVTFTLLLSWLTFVICHKLVVPITVKITEKTDIKWDDVLLNERTLRKACLIVPAIVVWMFIPNIFVRMPDIMELLERLTGIYITIMSTRLAIEVINSLKMLNSDAQSAHHQYLHTFCGVLKIVVVFLSVIVIVSIVINRNPLTLLAGLGATSAILMLVFKDTISGLVAGIRLTSNDMLHKGDWITVEKAGVNGTVEEITLTTVKVRNFDNTIVTITPQTLVDDSFQNWKPMQEGDGRRVMRRIYIDFHSVRLVTPEILQNLISLHYLTEKEATPEKAPTEAATVPGSFAARPQYVNLTLFRHWADRYLASHPLVNGDMTHMVRQLEATQQGLPVEFYFFLREKEWKTWENQKDEILERLYAAVEDFGLSIYQLDIK